MPEILPDHVPSPRTLLVWDGTRYRAVRGHTDGTLQVRGEDQLHSFGGVLASPRTAVISGAGGTVASQPVPAGQIWHVTHVLSRDNTNATTAHLYVLNHNGGGTSFHTERGAFAANYLLDYKCEIWLDPADTVVVWFAGALAGDTCLVLLIGEIMTLET